MLSWCESGIGNVAVILVRGLKKNLSHFGKTHNTGNGLWPPPIGDPLIPEELLECYEEWPEEPNIWKSMGDKDLLNAYDKWPKEPNIRKSMGGKDHHEDHGKWPDQPGIRLSLKTEDFSEDSVSVDGDPDVWKDPLPDHHFRPQSDYSRASHCPECDGTGFCSCSYVS